jgi:hypothetical protein
MSSGINLQLDPEALRPIVEAVATELLSRLEADRAQFDGNGKLAFPEAEAARLLSMNPWQLRDERLRERIKASVGPAGKILYTKADLLAYLASRRWKSSRRE